MHKRRLQLDPLVHQQLSEPGGCDQPQVSGPITSWHCGEEITGVEGCRERERERERETTCSCGNQGQPRWWQWGRQKERNTSDYSFSQKGSGDGGLELRLRPRVDGNYYTEGLHGSEFSSQLPFSSRSNLFFIKSRLNFLKETSYLNTSL